MTRKRKRAADKNLKNKIKDFNINWQCSIKTELKRTESNCFVTTELKQMEMEKQRGTKDMKAKKA